MACLIIVFELLFFLLKKNKNKKKNIDNKFDFFWKVHKTQKKILNSKNKNSF